jgi:hypothetical protein
VPQHLLLLHRLDVLLELIKQKKINFFIIIKWKR